MWGLGQEWNLGSLATQAKIVRIVKWCYHSIWGLVHERNLRPLEPQARIVRMVERRYHDIWGGGGASPGAKPGDLCTTSENCEDGQEALP